MLMLKLNDGFRYGLARHGCGWMSAIRFADGGIFLAGLESVKSLCDDGD